ncbi:CGNR zinc finger domain-containing protein [Taklimakanibacter lacteus]|uniref:CGNR zinc finger domain-containing protein n=1 Tax=Taklimakanibacter lacteus TaxID=2268456 RepID=UPI000E66D5BB
MADDGTRQDIHPSDWNFRFRSGRLCLDFIATMGDRDHLGFDRWRNARDLARWYVEARLLAREVAVSAGELDAARRLREALYRLVADALARKAPDESDLALVNAAAEKPPLVPTLTSIGRPSTWSSAAPHEAVLATVARDAIDLLSGSALARVRKCADAHCSVLFVDNSRPGRRRWCAMNGCGNKVKKAAYRRRQKT